MPENWNDIAAEVAAEIADLGFDVVFDVPSTVNTGTTANPVYAPPTPTPVRAIEKTIRRRDNDGNILQIVRALMIGASGFSPEKGWFVQVRGRKHRISEVRPLAPGGTDLLFTVELEG